MRRIVLALSVLSSLAFSSGIPVRFDHASEVAQVIASSRREVLMLVPSLRSRVVANALRKAVVEAGVSLEILCDTSLVNERSSFIPMLSMLHERKHNVTVRVLRGVNRTLLVVDQSRAVFGPLVSESDSFGLNPTRLVTDALEVRYQTRVFRSQWQKATPWTYTVQPPSFKTGGQK
jgi:uncharacterized protein YllA (UPF0747 family)